MIKSQNKNQKMISIRSSIHDRRFWIAARASFHAGRPIAKNLFRLGWHQDMTNSAINKLENGYKHAYMDFISFFIQKGRRKTAT